MLVIPNQHVSTLDELDRSVLHELMDLVVKAQHVLLQTYSPQGINVGLNMGSAAGAGIDQHLHFHVLPRWSADSNFMTTVGKTRVIPESLDESWRKIRENWDKS
jgi:ATP adenylyltransferase